MEKIYPAMISVMKDVGAISKDKVNQMQKFKFRGIDDVYNSLHETMAKHGVFSVPTVLEERSEERKTKNGGALIYRILKIKYTFYAEDGSSVEAIVIGEGMDSGDKASNKAMSIADKYCLLQAFKIPTEDISDPDSETHVIKDIKSDDKRKELLKVVNDKLEIKSNGKPLFNDVEKKKFWLFINNQKSVKEIEESLNKLDRTIDEKRQPKQLDEISSNLTF